MFTLTEQILIMTLALVALVLGFILGLIFMNKRKINRSIERPQTKLKIITAMMLDGLVNLHGDVTLPFVISHILMENGPIVYLKYYGDWTRMVCLMYDEEVGYVLIREDGNGEPKFYDLHKVIPCKTGEFVKGYIKMDADRNEIFVITELPITIEPVKEEDIVHV